MTLKICQNALFYAKYFCCTSKHRDYSMFTHIIFCVYQSIIGFTDIMFIFIFSIVITKFTLSNAFPSIRI